MIPPPPPTRSSSPAKSSTGTRKGRAGGNALSYDTSQRIIILHGPEVFLLQEHVRQLREGIGRQTGEPVDVIYFDGATCSMADVLDELRSLGLMQQYKLVVADNADQLIKGSGGASSKRDGGDNDGGSGAEDEDDEGASRSGKGSQNRKYLENYAKAPVESATLVLRGPTWRPGNLDKLVISGGGAVIKCELQPPEAAVAFCVHRCKEAYQCTIERDAAASMVDRLGTGLARLDSELGRLSLMVDPKRTVIDAQLVNDQIALSREEKAWEIQNALLQRDPGFAMAKMVEMLTVSKLPAEVLFYFVTDLARKLHSASRMLRQGVYEGDVAKQLRIWGSSLQPFMQAARHTEPAELADLLGKCLERARRPRQGLGDSRRSIELLTVDFLTTLAPVRR